jgi:membrane protease YdiL (CAAX protease family)
MPRAILGLLAAVPIWAWVFRGPPSGFWRRMTIGAGALGLFGLMSSPDMRDDLPEPGDLAIGAASAAGLYVIFQIGDRMARVVMPAGEEDIEKIYRLRTLAPKGRIAALLVCVIAPGEELFWRGLIGRAFVRRFGRVRGTLLASAAYGGTHLVTGNLTLAGAAGVAGAYWGAEYALDSRLGPLFVSHILWDIWIFLLQPTPTGKKSR